MSEMNDIQKRERARNTDRSDTKVYLVGGGIASLAAAAFLIRDGGVLGKNITIYEELDRLGGSLDGAGSPEEGYVLRGGRMMESKYLCTYDLFSAVPTLDRSKTVTQEIFEWNEVIKTHSHARLVRDGQPINAPEFGLSEKNILKIEWLIAEPEGLLGRTSIADQMGEEFLQTNFWLMWCTTFAFQPWHSAVEFKRYLVRFTHMVQGFNQLHGIMRTVFNQYDSLVRPLERFLIERNVKFLLKSKVEELVLRKDIDAEGFVEKIIYTAEGKLETVEVRSHDLVIVTLGSMTEASALGSNGTAAVVKSKKDGGSWTLWEKIAASRPEFGKPAVFTDHIDESKWISITTTLYDPDFLELVRSMTGNVPGEGGLVTFADSNWLCSIVIPAQPHFIGQPEDVQVFWGYGLYVDKPGNFVPKPMQDCSGAEIFTEILGHLHISEEQQKSILANSRTIPCMMPFITSQFLRREKGDRPEVLPKGWKNLAFTGQFCEQPDDVVFTVEYSVRSAASAAYGLLDIDRKPPAVYKGQYDPRVLYKAIKGLHDLD
ncbi:oleate hydratase [Terriglobus saanensis]|uniref:67 kDa myosin-cross-reactive antigen family protein n=1 Tax=Terriglobus saanensis (strain ATCC BAA-1853 / DSM 23119 / SP1PR4) TaxID=401053 RepID=E8V7Y7_TERSS|nr:oleate hydratase [Terriglobus saanensis]ADV82911.1 67 kDa myosin-cross-reactive antigen family protein [Terriglobus saanensis SP1PR4]